MPNKPVMAKRNRALRGEAEGVGEGEFNTFGTTHSEVGLCLAQRWNFPAAYCDVILNHHTADLADEDQLLTAIVALADFYCLSHAAANGIAQASIPGHSEEHAWEVLKQYASKLIPSTLERFLTDLDDEYETVMQEVDFLFNSMTAD